MRPGDTPFGVSPRQSDHRSVRADGADLSAGTPEPFLVSDAFEVYPAFSPDGRWIAFFSERGGAKGGRSCEETTTDDLVAQALRREKAAKREAREARKEERRVERQSRHRPHRPAAKGGV